MPEWPDAEELAAVSPQSVIDGAMTQIVGVAVDRGLCVEAVRSGAVSHAVLDDPDVAWPEFASRARPLGVGGALAPPSS